VVFDAMAKKINGTAVIGFVSASRVVEYVCRRHWHAEVSPCPYSRTMVLEVTWFAPNPELLGAIFFE
jgi:hypothetical protein